MNTTRFARYFALPIISAGIIGGAALGLAGTASAANNTDVRPRTSSRRPTSRRTRHPRRCRARSGTAGSTKSMSCGRATSADKHHRGPPPEELGEGLGALAHSMRAGQRSHRNALRKQRLPRLSKGAATAAGLSRITFHDLRHSYATGALKAGYTPRWSATALGMRTSVSSYRPTRTFSETTTEKLPSRRPHSFSGRTGGWIKKCPTR